MNIEAISPALLSEAGINVDQTFLSQNFYNGIDSSQVNSLSFLNMVGNVDGQIKYADTLTESYLNGENIPVHDLVIAMNKAKTEVELLVEIKNKVLEAYQEISKLQI